MSAEVVLYHATSRERAEAIMSGGFKDHYVGLDQNHDAIEAIWFTSNPFGECDYEDATVIAVHVPRDIAEEIRTEALDGESIYYGVIRASVVNQYPRTLAV